MDSIEPSIIISFLKCGFLRKKKVLVIFASLTFEQIADNDCLFDTGFWSSDKKSIRCSVDSDAVKIPTANKKNRFCRKTGSSDMKRIGHESWWNFHIEFVWFIETEAFVGVLISIRNHTVFFSSSNTYRNTFLVPIYLSRGKLQLKTLNVLKEQSHESSVSVLAIRKKRLITTQKRFTVVNCPLDIYILSNLTKTVNARTQRFISTTEENFAVNLD